MLSLHDEITKFEKHVYNKELNEFISIEQMFVGGGVTIQSLVKENHFIVEELKKMSALFVNFCKLNDKIYKKIVQHEVNIHNDHDKLNITVSTVDRKLVQAVKTMKQLHEDTLYQNKESKVLVEKMMDPIKQEIKKKVDNSTFATKIKEILDQQDQIGQGKQGRKGGEGEGSGNQEYRQVTLEDGTVVMQPITKKKAKPASTQELDKFKLQINATLAQINQKHQKNQKLQEETSLLLQKFIPTINKSSEQILNHEEKLEILREEQKNQTNYINSCYQKSILELNTKINEDIWQFKFQRFNQTHVKQDINRIQKFLKDFQTHSSSKFDQFLKEQTQHKHDISSNASNIEQLKEITSSSDHKIAINQKAVHDEIVHRSTEMKRINQKIHHLKQDFSKQTQVKVNDINKTVEQIKQSIKFLSLTIEQSILKSVTKKNEAQMKQIQNSIRQIKANTKDLQQKIGSTFDQIINIQDLVSKKANFTDIIYNFEKKADRQDIKQLKDKIDSTGMIKSMENNFYGKSDRQSTRRKSSLSRTSKTLIFPHSNIHKNTDDHSKFLPAFDDPVPENRQNLSHNSRRKLLRTAKNNTQFNMN